MLRRSVQRARGHLQSRRGQLRPSLRGSRRQHRPMLEQP